MAIATYNERANLPDLVAQIFEALPSADILVVDDGSPDGTGEWCAGHAALEPRLSCLQRGAKLGLGTAAIAGMQHAINHRYDVVVNLDADHSHNPARIPELVSLVTNGDENGQPIDVAVGSRYVEGGSIHGWPVSRQIASRIVNGMARAFFRLPVADCSGSFRAYRVSKLVEMDLSSIESEGYSFYEEVLWRLNCVGATFKEIPIAFHERKLGETKVNFREIKRSVGKLMRLGFRAMGSSRRK